MFYGHTISMFLKEKAQNAYGTHTTHLISLAWFHSKEKAQALLDRLNSIEENKNLNLFLFEDNMMLEKPIYEDELGLENKPHSWAVRQAGYDLQIKDH